MLGPMFPRWRMCGGMYAARPGGLAGAWGACWESLMDKLPMGRPSAMFAIGEEICCFKEPRSAAGSGDLIFSFSKQGRWQGLRTSFFDFTDKVLGEQGASDSEMKTLAKKSRYLQATREGREDRTFSHFFSPTRKSQVANEQKNRGRDRERHEMQIFPNSKKLYEHLKKREGGMSWE